MKRVKLGIGLVLLGMTAIFVFRYFQVRNTPAFVAQPSSFSLQPPAQAITGTLAETHGVVEHRTREADYYAEATPGGTIRQGESVASKNGSATIMLGNLGSVSMKKETEVSFVNLIPASLTVWQKAGTASYEVNTSHPFSIRVSGALVILNGDATITMKNITVTRGTARIARVDNDNKTNVTKIRGKTVYIF